MPSEGTEGGKGSEEVKGSGNIGQEGSSNIAGMGPSYETILSSSIQQEGSDSNMEEESKERVLRYCRSLLEGSQPVKIQVSVRFLTPSVVLEPGISEVYDVIMKLLLAMTDLLDRVQPWVGVSEMEEEGEGEALSELIVDSIHSSQGQLNQFFTGNNHSNVILKVTSIVTV